MSEWLSVGFTLPIDESLFLDERDGLFDHRSLPARLECIDRFGSGMVPNWCFATGEKVGSHTKEREGETEELQWFSDCLGSGNLVLAREKKIVEGNTSSAEWYMIVSRETEELVAGFQAGIRSRESNKTIRYKAMFARL